MSITALLAIGEEVTDVEEGKSSITFEYECLFPSQARLAVAHCIPNTVRIFPTLQSGDRHRQSRICRLARDYRRCDNP